MPRSWNDKRERQYEHIKEDLEDRGRSVDTAEEIAARTVNKERARAGESKTASRTSTDDIRLDGGVACVLTADQAAGPRPSSTARHGG
jgi:hypothetical protein